MRTLLRHTETGLFLQGAGKWTETTERAYDFRFIERARHFVRLWELENVEVAFAFEDSPSISTLSLETLELKDAA
jgi:hypothetical protein